MTDEARIAQELDRPAARRASSRPGVAAVESLTRSHRQAEAGRRGRAPSHGVAGAGARPGPRVLRPPTVPLVQRPARGLRPGLQHLFEGRGWIGLRLLYDLLMALLGTAVAAVTAGTAGSDPAARASLFVFPLAVVAMLYLRGMYRRQVRVAMLDAIAPLAGGVSVAAMSVLAWEVIVHQDAAAGPVLGRAWAFTLVLLGGGRLALGMVQHQLRARRHVGRPTLIVGAGVVGAQVARRLDEHPEYGLRPVGFLDAAPMTRMQTGARSVRVLGSPDDLAEVVAATGAQHVILAFTSASDRELIPLTRRCDALGLEVSLVPRLFESINDRVALERLGGLPLLGLRALDPKGWQFKVKYALDRPFAALVLLAVAPTMLLAALAVKLTSPGPIIFRQRRVGRDGQAFDLLKFRSMRVEPEPGTFRPDRGVAPGGIEGADRRTPIGRFLRRSSIDELPQFINVLRGEMSIVGPRPERPEFVELFESHHARYADRHRVKSGITGWSQVHGLRGQTSLADRIEWDNFYIENWSLWLDVKVLLMTLGAVLRSGE